MKVDNPIVVSIVIPVFNEEEIIGSLLQHLQQEAAHKEVMEVLVIDGGSTDATVKIAEANGAIVVHSEKGKAKQMNLGAMLAKGTILYFLHADTFPPKHFDTAIKTAVEKDEKAGCFRLQFNSPSRFLSFFSWFTRFNVPLCRGGDQSLFITKTLFKELGGFNDSYRIYEDNEFIGRLYRKASFTVLPLKVLTSSRKYEINGAWTLQYHFTVIHLKKFFGASPEKLYAYYNKNIQSQM
ncbi:MAG: glycosyltransferase family 2 protein [Eudoraea sp.]|nr:glycosyltransferase family 2 protein [Eudoraea sp.]